MSSKKISMAASTSKIASLGESSSINPSVVSSIAEMKNSLFGIMNDNVNDIREIPVSLIQPFKNHPFKVMENEDMEKLIESIQETGKIYTPLLLRSVGPNVYECISGHRRLFAAKKIGLTKVPALIVEMTDDEAVIAMVDSNMQREVILPSERAYSLKMKMDALNHQGKKMVLQNESDSMAEIGAKESMGRTQVHRYIRLTYLIPELLDLVDSGKLPFVVGVELSHFSVHMQKLVNQYIGEYGCIKLDQVALIRQYRDSEDMTFENLVTLLVKPVSVPKKKVTLSEKKLYKYFPAHYTPSEMEEVILELLKKWRDENVD